MEPGKHEALFKHGGRAEQPGFKYMQVRFGRLLNFLTEQGCEVVLHIKVVLLLTGPG